MKKLLFVLVFILISISSFAQEWMKFTYSDNGGNHYKVIDDIKREIWYHADIYIYEDYSKETYRSKELYFSMIYNEETNQGNLIIHSGEYNKTFFMKDVTMEIYQKYNSDQEYTFYVNNYVKAVVQFNLNNAIVCVF